MGMLLHRHFVEVKSSTEPVTAKEYAPVLEEGKEEVAAPTAASNPTKKPTKKAQK